MYVTTLQKCFLLFLLIQVMVKVFAQHTKECVIKECVNYTTCIETYADVYSALASPKNYFNIALALYPARKPSSVLVHVNLHTLNQTRKSSPVPYTWSMSCLYAALPAKVLELLSLGSILVTSRKQNLSITIAPFCCNVSEDDRCFMIERVLAEVSYQQLFSSVLQLIISKNLSKCDVNWYATYAYLSCKLVVVYDQLVNAVMTFRHGLFLLCQVLCTKLYTFLVAILSLALCTDPGSLLHLIN